eukprot:311563-Prymnesium_polylepis.1
MVRRVAVAGATRALRCLYLARDTLSGPAEATKPHSKSPSAPHSLMSGETTSRSGKWAVSGGAMPRSQIARDRTSVLQVLPNPSYRSTRTVAWVALTACPPPARLVGSGEMRLGYRGKPRTRQKCY